MKLPLGMISSSLEVLQSRLERDPAYSAEARMLRQVIGLLDDKPSASAERMRRVRAERKANKDPNACANGSATRARTVPEQKPEQCANRPPSALPLSDSQSSETSGSSLDPRSLIKERERARVNGNSAEQARTQTPNAFANGSPSQADAPSTEQSFAAYVEADAPGIDSGVLAEHVAQALKAATGHAWESMGHAPDLLWIADRPAAEVRRAFARLAREVAEHDPWVCAGKASPRWIRKYWTKYIAPEVQTREQRSSADEERRDRVRRRSCASIGCTRAAAMARSTAGRGVYGHRTY